MNKDFTRKQSNPFAVQETSIAAVDEALYGKLDLPESGRVVSKPISIMDIWADVKQPRRAIPSAFRLHWNGEPKSAPALLNEWHRVAEKKAGIKIDPLLIINGRGEGLDVENLHPIADDYIAMLRLAQSIKADGLINPVTVVERGREYLIETGERRWLAYQLLHMWLGDKFAKIPARVSDEKDTLWRQAQENTARRALNAIGMARQLALLIMDTRAAMDGQHYDAYEQIVLPGECDRRYYAQIANGNVHRIPKGMGERIEAAMGLSKGRINHYRALLKLTDDEIVNDALWTKADMENVGDKSLREIVSGCPLEVLKDVVASKDWGFSQIAEYRDRYNQLYLSPKIDSASSSKRVAVAEQSPAQMMTPAQQQLAKMLTSTYHVGDMVETRTGKVGRVEAVMGNMATVRFAEGTRLSLVAETLTVWNGGASSDNAPSIVTSPALAVKPLLAMGGDGWQLLMDMEALFRARGEVPLADGVKDLRMLSANQAMVLGEALPALLDEIYTEAGKALQRLHGDLYELLDGIAQRQVAQDE